MMKRIAFLILLLTTKGCAEGQVSDVEAEARIADLRALAEWVAIEQSFSASGLRLS